ncbi:glycosyltransferase family 39 protein [Kribbella sp. NPDC026596]|uniref:ArnT family glycosyltransferase n=1 Tax=Kribbella sp. NPDC026596 TaxID=3155122 RepID=UPI0033CEB694
MSIIANGIWVTMVHPPPTSDYAWYAGAATRMSHGLGYVGSNGQPTAYWPVGWPFVLSVLFRLTGPSVAAGLTLQVVITAATSVLIALFARHITRSNKAALTAGVAYSLLPEVWAWNSQLGTEQLFTLLTLGMLYSLARASSWRGYAVAGAFAGSACLVRPTLLLFPLVLLGIEFIRQRRRRASIGRVAVFVAGMVLVVAPWTIRNAVVFESFVPVSTNGGVNLYQGTRTTDGYWWSNDPNHNPLLHASSEVERDRLGVHLALRYWAHHPQRFVADIPPRLKALYSGNDIAFRWLHGAGGWSIQRYHTWRSIADVAYWVFMAVAFIGVIRAWQNRRHSVWLLGCFVLFYSALWMFFPVWDRFRFPLMPVFAIWIGGVFSVSRLSNPQNT